jgi:uncharacterized protein (TIGR03435 family)
MLQALLEERFKLQVHREKKEMPVYALVVGKIGTKFKESAPDAAHLRHTDKAMRRPLKLMCAPARPDDESLGLGGARSTATGTARPISLKESGRITNDA